MTRAANRILLDSNVWRYIVDAGALPAIQHAARRSRNVIVVAPAVLYEAAQTRNEAIRDRLLAAMASRVWKRLMPEAYSEAEELKAEVRRLRPEWVRPNPDLTLFKRVRHDWMRAQGGLWDRIRDDAELLQQTQAGMLKRAREQARELRDDAMAWADKWRTANLTKTMASFAAPLPGWNGQPVEPWRVDGLNVFKVSVQTPGHPAIDWLDGELDLELMLFQSASLTTFWLHDVEAVHMPRHWLRWAFEFMQRLHKVTDGTPGDTQLGTYLVDADVFLSADKVFVAIAEKCRADAPFCIAEARLCAHDKVVGHVMDALEVE